MALLLRLMIPAGFLLFVFSCSSNAPGSSGCVGDVTGFLEKKHTSVLNGTHVFIAQKYCNCVRENVNRINSKFNTDYILYMDTTHFNEYALNGLRLDKKSVIHTSMDEFESFGMVFYNPFFVRYSNKKVEECGGF